MSEDKKIFACRSAVSFIGTH